MEAHAGAVAAPTSNKQPIPFEDRDFGSAQLLQIFSCGKTTLFGAFQNWKRKAASITRETASKLPDFRS
jgi:hypothetical protein